MTTLKVEIEADSEEGIYPLLQHVFKELTEIDYYNSDIEDNSIPEDGWLKIKSGRFKGAYRWAKE